ncbi:hypothetical protein F7U70_002370 [Vibrio fluvialis]|nr:hypothetical protein [Vibrio fluvialis]
MIRFYLIVSSLLVAGCVSFGPPPIVYRFSDSAHSVYTDKGVNKIVYFGNKNHYVFTVNDTKMQYLIKNANKGNLHINIASNHFVQDIGDVITFNLVDVSFKVADASQELIEWSRENGIYYDDNRSIGPQYSYQVYLDAKRYLANENVNCCITSNSQKLSMSFETLVDPNEIELTESPVEIINGQPYLGDMLLFELIDYGWHNNTQYRTILYKENVND